MLILLLLILIPVSLVHLIKFSCSLQRNNTFYIDAIVNDVTLGNQSQNTESSSLRNPWRGYDNEDNNLLFSILYRAIFKEDLYSSDSSTLKFLNYC